MAIEPFLGTRAQKAFLITVVVQAIIVLTMVSISFGLVANNANIANYKTLPCYLALFGLAEIFEVIVAVDALKLRNVIQLMGIVVFHSGMIIFGALQVGQTKEALVTRGRECNPSTYVTCDGAESLFSLVEIFLIIAPVVLSLSLVVIVYFVYELYHEFGWVVFHVVGANRQMKNMYHYYQILICLLKFDFFCFTALTIQLLILVLDRSGAEFSLTIIAIPVVLVLTIGCVWAVKKEIKWLMVISLIMMLGAQAYFLYKFSRLFAPETRDLYRSTRGTLAVFSIVSFLLLFATFAVGLRCFTDFDKDLLEAKSTDTKFDTRPKSDYSVSGNYAMAPTASPPPRDLKGGPGERTSVYTAAGAPLGRRISID